MKYLLTISALFLLSACQELENNAQDFNAVMFIMIIAMIIPVVAIIYAFFRFRKKSKNQQKNHE